MKKGLNFRTIDAIFKRKNGMAFEIFSSATPEFLKTLSG